MLLVSQPTQRNTALWYIPTNGIAESQGIYIFGFLICYTLVVTILSPLSAICKEIPLLSFVVRLVHLCPFCRHKIISYHRLILFSLMSNVAKHTFQWPIMFLCEMCSYLLLIFLFICWGLLYSGHMDLLVIFAVDSFFQLAHVAAFLLHLWYLLINRNSLILMWSDFFYGQFFLCPAYYVLPYPKVVQIISCIFF